MKKLVKKKKPIDLISEIDGKPVYPVVKKEKTPDLTDEIKSFLSSEITHDAVMRILLRTQCSALVSNLQKNKMKIFKVSRQGYFITITSKKRESRFFMDHFNLFEIGMFGGQRDFMTSRLKMDMHIKIYNWLESQNLPFSMDQDKI